MFWFCFRFYILVTKKTIKGAGWMREQVFAYFNLIFRFQAVWTGKLNCQIQIRRPGQESCRSTQGKWTSGENMAIGPSYLFIELNWVLHWLFFASWYSPEEMYLSFLLAMNLWIEPLKLCFFRNSFFQVLKWIWTASRFRRFPMSTRSFCREKFPGFSEGILSLVGRGSRSTVLASLEVKCKIKAAPIVMLPLYKRRLFRARHSFLVVSLEPITNTLSKSTKWW